MLVVEGLLPARRAFESRPHKAHILGMRALQDQVRRRLCERRIPIDLSRLFRPKNALRTGVHSDASSATQSLGICEMRFAATKLDFRRLPSSDVHDRSDDLDAAVLVCRRLANDVQVLGP